MSFPDHIFKAYDIRGLVEADLSEDLAYKIGRAFVVLLRKEGIDFRGKRLIVGRDMRPSSILFEKKVVEGMLDEGVDVLQIGMVSTPVFNFSCANFPEYAGGIMVTASHNPAEYNGFKLTRHDGMPVGKGNGMEDIRDMVQNFSFSDAPLKGMALSQDLREEYIKKLFTLVDTSSIQKLKIVIDGGNGMGDVTFPLWLKRLPIDVEYLYMEPDGTFPNHEANPLKVDTLRDLQKKVLETHADFGFALDGDADRIGLVDEKGEVVEASYVGAILGQEVLKKHPGMHMLYDLRSSMIGPQLWEAEGATTEKCMVGHALIKKMMREVGAGFASELSLHIFYGDLYNLESSDLCLLYFLQILSREQKPLSALIAPLKVYFHSGEINFETEKKDEIMKHIEEIYRESAKEILSLDGLWMKFDWGWMSLRKSNTEPVLRLNVEATTQEKTIEIVEAIKKLIV